MLSLKKNLLQQISNAPTKDVYFFDEARFGTHSKLGHGWFEKGSRTGVNCKLGFKNFYMYSAINPKTGEDLSIILDKVNTTSFNVFLDEFSKQLGPKEVLFVMDNASWHKSKELIVPINIQIVYLPPYSPELNPVERFWEYIKSKTIRNKIYKSINDLYSYLVNFYNSLDLDTIKSICNYGY